MYELFENSNDNLYILFYIRTSISNIKTFLVNKTNFRLENNLSPLKHLFGRYEISEDVYFD